MTAKNLSKRGVAMVTRPPKFLNANNSKTVKATDLKFDKSVLRDSPDVTPKNFCERGRGQGHVAP